MTTLQDANPTITFMKPELYRQISDAYRLVNGQRLRTPSAQRMNDIKQNEGWSPKSFISLVDIFKEDWDDRTHLDFFRENLREEGYDIIECRSDQIELIVEISSGTVFPEVLIVHVQDPSKTLKLPTQFVSFFILKARDGRRITIEVPVSDKNLLIYHPGSQITIEPSDEFRGTAKQYERFRFEPDVHGKVRPPGTRASDYPEALVAHLSITDTDSGKAAYIISDGDFRQGCSRFASLVAHEHFKVNDPGTDSARKTYLVVHGRPQRFDVPFSHGIEIFFPDMSETEIATIWKNPIMFIGNDKSEYGSGATIGNYKYQYFRGRMTISEQLFAENGLAPIVPFSYIDSYLDTLVFKRPNGMFDLMINKLSTVLADKDADVVLRDSPITRELLGLVQDRVRRESKLDAQRRVFLISRAKELTNAIRPAAPYLAERAIGNPVLEEEQRFREKIGEQTGYDPVTRARKRYDLTPVCEWRYIKDEDYIVLEGREYMCVVHNCGFVVALGSGKVRISGTLHSLVVGKDVQIELDNISPIPFNPELYLYVQNGSIFDGIINYKDKLTQEEIEKLVTRTERTTELPDWIKAPPGERSVIKNLYCDKEKLPCNYRTAEIQNIQFVSGPMFSPSHAVTP